MARASPLDNRYFGTFFATEGELPTSLRALDGLARRRERESQRRASRLGPIDPDASAVPFRDLLANRQADARAGILGFGMKPLKDHPNPLRVFPGNADSIVPHGNFPRRPIPRGGYVHPWRLFTAPRISCRNTAIEREAERRPIGRRMRMVHAFISRLPFEV